MRVETASNCWVKSRRRFVVSLSALGVGEGEREVMVRWVEGVWRVV